MSASNSSSAYNQVKFLLGQNPPIESVVKENRIKLQQQMMKMSIQQRTHEMKKQIVISRIRKLAEKGDRNQAAVVAREYTELKRMIATLEKSKQQISNLDGLLSRISATSQTAEALKDTQRSMKQVNMVIKPSKLVGVLSSFSKEKERINNLDEVINNAIGDAMEIGDDEDSAIEEEEQLVNSIFEELGINFGSSLPDPRNNNIKNNNLTEDEEFKMQIDSLAFGTKKK